MPLSILTNMASLSAQDNVRRTQGLLQQSVERLSSGLRINHASDDAAGLAISSTLESQLLGLAQASRNAQDAVSMFQAAETGMLSVNSLLGRMRQLAVESANGGTLTASNRASIQTEYKALQDEVSRIVSVTSYNGQNLIDGSFSAGSSFQVGVFNQSTNVIALNISNVNSSAGLHINTTSVNTAGNAQGSLSALDKAISTLSSDLATIGAAQMRLATTVDNLSQQYTGYAGAISNIRDVDVADETANLTKTQILLQSGISVLSQANSMPSQFLSLLYK